MEGEGEPNIDNILDNFDRLDTNGDGVLSPEELEGELTPNQFAALDTNNDGVLTRDELGGHVEPVEGENEGESDEGENEGEEVEGEGELETIEEIADYLGENYDIIDLDNSGLLNYTEVMAALPYLTRSEFNELDRNNDGYLSLTELQAALEPQDEGCGCCKCTADTKINFKRYLGDWLLVGLSLLVLSAYVKRK